MQEIKEILGFIPGWERSPRVGNGNLLQYSYLENFMDSGTRQATVYGVTESDTNEPLSAHTYTILYFDFCI